MQESNTDANGVNFHQINPFDENQKDRIKNLLKLNGICLYQHQILEEINNANAEKCKSLFSNIIDITNVVLVWQLFDEVTASLENRGSLSDLLGEIKELTDNDIISNSSLEPAYTLAFSDLNNRTLNGQVMYTDFINGSMYQDFIVNTYSAFELWMCKLYDVFFDDKDVISRRKEKLEKVISKQISSYSFSIDGEKEIVSKWFNESKIKIIDQISTLNGNYISSNEKIEKIIKLVKTKAKDFCEKNPSVEILSEDDIKLLKFYALQRNTVHNLGVHSRSSEHSFYGVNIEAGKPSYYKNWSDNINLCLDLLTIYIKIISILEVCNHPYVFEIFEN